MLDLYTPYFAANGFTDSYLEDFDSLFEADDALSFELILTELIIVGGSIIDFVEKFRKYPDFISNPIFVISDICSQNHISSILANRCDEYLIKPLPKELLIGKISTIYERATYSSVTC